MKKFGKLTLVLALVAILSVAALVTAFAGDGTEYTGDINELVSLVGKVKDSDGAELEDAIAAVGEYIAQTPVDPNATGYDTAMKSVYAKAVAYATVKVGESKALPSTEEKSVALASASRVLSPFDIPENTSGYSALMSSYLPEALLVANALVDGCDVAQGTALNGVAVNKVRAFVKLHPAVLNDETFKGEYDAALEAQDSAIAELIEEYNNSHPLNEFNLEVMIRQDFSEEDASGLYGFTQLINVEDNKNSIKRETDGDNGYLAFDFYDAYHSYIRTDLPAYEQGTVIEFDITTSGVLPRNGIEIASSSATAPDGTTRYYPGYGSIDSSGTFKSRAKLNTGTNEVIKNAFVPGEWLHISMVFHHATGLIDYYVNYQYMGSGDGSSGYPGYHNLKCFRIGSVNNIDGSATPEYDGGFAIDNFTVYQGNGIRTVDLFDKMTDSERFVYYSNYLTVEDASVPDKKIAYDMATELIDKYWLNNKYLTTDPAVCAAVDIYVGFDYDALYNAYCAENLATFIEKIEAYEALGRTYDNRSLRETTMAEITTYLDKVGKHILKDDLYQSTYDKYLEYRAYIEMDVNIESFCLFVDRVYLSFAAEPMKKHYDTCTKLLETIDVRLAGKEGFEYFTEQYAKYLDADAEVYRRAGTENAKKIVECVAIIADYDTEEEWKTNFDYVNKYVLLIRGFIKTGNVDSTYEGLAEAMEFFDVVNDYFYGKLQQSHIEHIEEQLQAFVDAESYIEKMGICAYLNAYFANEDNDVDMSNPDLIGLKNSLDIYNAEMEARKEDYKYILAQNTAFFTNAVRKMLTATDYTTKKMYFDEATGYYYAMNVGDEAIAEYLAIYDAATVELVAFRNASSNFILATDVLKGKMEDPLAEESDVYAALIDCYVYRDSVAMDIEGVSEAAELFDALYEKYNSAAETANAELLDAGVAMLAVRGNLSVRALLGTVYRLVYEY